MFGRVAQIGRHIAEVNWKVLANRTRVESLEKQVKELIHALEWHIGEPLAVTLAERNLVKLQVAEQKRLIEEAGSIDLVNVKGGEPHDPTTKMDRGCDSC